MGEFNESPLFLLLGENVSPTAKELPIQLYETGTQMVNSIPKMLFVKLPYKIETVEAERVSVDHVAKVSATSGDAGSTACTCTARIVLATSLVLFLFFFDSWTATSLLFVDPRFRRNPITLHSPISLPSPTLLSSVYVPSHSE